MKHISLWGHSHSKLLYFKSGAMAALAGGAKEHSKQWSQQMGTTERDIPCRPPLTWRVLMGGEGEEGAEERRGRRKRGGKGRREEVQM